MSDKSSDKSVLSQDEIDALLSNSDDDGTNETDEGGRVVKVYDLTAKSLPRHGRLPVLEMITERFSRALRKSLQTLFRYPVEIGAAGQQSLTFGELNNLLNVPTSVSVTTLHPIQGHSLICLDAPLVYGLVDRYFGGQTNSTEQTLTARDFTPTEKRVIGRVRDLLAVDFCAAWQDVLPVSYALVAEESNPHLVNVFSQEDELLMLSYPISFEGGAGQLQIVLPHAGLEPYLNKLGGLGRTEGPSDDPSWQQTIEAQLLDSTVPLRCCVATAEVRLQDLLDMSPGDVLKVEMPQRHQLLAQDVPVFSGTMQEQAGKLVLQG